MSDCENARVARSKVMNLRRSLSKEECLKTSAEVIGRFFSLCKSDGSAWKGKLVGVYRALPGELDLSLLESRLSDMGARVCYPVVKNRAAKEMDFMEVALAGRGVAPATTTEIWKTGPYGNEEPHGKCSVVNTSEIAVIFVPGVAFGISGERIGRGAGFYDRFLPKATGALRVALAFDFQLFAALEQAPWDQKMHCIVTEKREFGVSEVKKRFK